MIKILLSCLLGFVLSAILTPFLRNLIRKKSYGQTILNYVEEHKSKQGTATMGGIVFFISTLSIVFFINKFAMNYFVALMVATSFSILGLMDDYIKIRFKQNMGLRAYQKIIGQVGISTILGCYVYFFSGLGGSLVVPFTMNTINIGFWIIPLIILVCIATTNSVNLSDGLDGLAGSVSSVFFAGLIALFMIFYSNNLSTGESAMHLDNILQLSNLSSIFLGSILGFLVFNTFKASIFMGDVGSLGIGGMISAVCAVSGFSLFIPILGIMFVITALSDIIQVLYFKKTKKRVFKMAPIHHHFQMSGHAESKIVFAYSVITFFVALLTIAITIAI